jgi:fatty acid desaturase
MYIPCYRLEATHALLKQRGLTQNMEIKQGYRQILELATAKSG